jgi:hypothetical protein
MNGIPGWRTECIDCHDPHFQKQLDNHGLENFYLVVGRLVSVTSDTPQAGLTSISYTSITIQNGWNLPPHSDNADWAAKTGSGRGLILVADSSNPQETFEVESATAQQIIIRGTLSSTYAGGTFGLIYGQLVRTTVNGSPVVFSSPAVFADNDGLAGGEDATPDGICQVCHIPTTPQKPTHWLSDGTLAQDHFNNVECAYCHNPAQGFRVVAPNHDLFIGGSVYCVDCHSDTEIVEVIHKENCGSCHGNADSLVLAGFEIVNNGGTINCETCHGTGYYSHSSFGP